MNIETEETTVRRIRITGPYDEGGEVMDQVMDQLHEDGWRIKRTGPYTDEEMHPEVEVDRFLIVAEKEINSPASGVLESYVDADGPIAQAICELKSAADYLHETGSTLGAGRLHRVADEAADAAGLEISEST